jgi:hypothetical protein
MLACYPLVLSFRHGELTMDEKEIFLFGINPVLEALKVSPNDICEILIGKGSSAPALRGVEGGRSGINI